MGSEIAGKRAAGYTAVDRFVQNNTCIGLGTGTTAFYAIERVGQRIAAGERIVAVATSIETERLCEQQHIPVVALLEREIAVAIDGADQIAPDWALTKGGGGALFREKAVALCAKRFVIVATPSKLVPALGAFPLPVEIVPYAMPYVVREIRSLQPDIEIVRRGRDAPFVTDNGNWILDCHFGEIDRPAALDSVLKSVHGVVASGIFAGLANDVVIGREDETAIMLPQNG
ncbi:MAG: ribose-5-phosphate isomerase RpiA [Candidatus Eremiobacteraeota bacterium]|nr:ribose-5-phosphate isomerase RpiA [Candidatus Eremiobacteraeota bacterium]